MIRRPWQYAGAFMLVDGKRINEAFLFDCHVKGNNQPEVIPIYFWIG